MIRSTLFAAVLAVAVGSGTLAFAQASDDWAIDQAQRAVRERITNRDGERDVTVRFAPNARIESSSNADLRVRGTGTATRSRDRKARPFSYDAVVNSRNSHVSDVNYDWRGGWDTVATNRLTGAYRLNRQRSDDAGSTADRATRDLPSKDQQRLRNAIMRRLDAPESLAIEREGRTLTMASSQARPVTFEADGREQSERSGNGRNMRTTATLSGDRLVVSTEGDRSVDYEVTFEPMDDGRSLRVTRRITHEDLRQAVVAKSVYEKTSDVPQFDIGRSGRDSYAPPATTRDRFLVPDGTELMAVLNDDLSTQRAHDGDRFTLSVRSPSQYADATIEGYVVRTSRSGQVSGRAEMAFEFDSIRQRDGRTYGFAGSLESVRTSNGDTVRVDNEGTIQDEGSQTTRTVERTGIGAAIGAVIGAAAGGGQGAAIGAAVGGGAGAGSVFIQGRDDLELKDGTEFRIRARSGR
jgi:hypothetical protein